MKKAMRCLCVLILILTLVGSFQATPVRAASFTVDTTTDAHDSNTADGTCNNGIDGCSLRAAIEQAFTVSSAGSPLTIHFWSGISGGTITLNLGPINWAADYVTLDGESYGITISGAGLSSGQSIFIISGSHNTIDHLTIRNSPWYGVQMGDFAGVGAGNYNTVSNSYLLGNGAAGVFVYGGASGGGQGNTVIGSFIGLTDLDATGCAAGEGNLGDGVYITANASATLIVSNIIACSSFNGIWIDGSGGAPTGTEIRYNLIGLNQAGAMPNYAQGIRDQQGVNTIIAANDISGNADAGVWLLASSGAKLTDNWIGTDVSGQTAVPNGIDGVAITDGATNNFVGGNDYTSPLDRNVISGNTGCGVRIRDGATSNWVDFNLIGLNVSGSAAVPNGTAGICIFHADANYIGSSSVGISQYISGNTREGIYVEGSSGIMIGATNVIGVGTNDTTAIGNGLEGIMLNGASNSFVAPDNLSYNGGAGVAVLGNTSTGNLIYLYEAHDNAGLPIDLGNDGATPNGTQTPPGPNNWLGYPVITASSGSPATIQGTACANCLVIIYRAIGNPAANGGGGIILSETTANGSGIWSATLPAGLTRADVSLVAQNYSAALAADTSEMSPVYKVYLPLLRR